MRAADWQHNPPPEPRLHQPNPRENALHTNVTQDIAVCILQNEKWISVNLISQQTQIQSIQDIASRKLKTQSSLQQDVLWDLTECAVTMFLSRQIVHQLDRPKTALRSLVFLRLKPRSLGVCCWYCGSVTSRTRQERLRDNSGDDTSAL